MHMSSHEAEVSVTRNKDGFFPFLFVLALYLFICGMNFTHISDTSPLLKPIVSSAIDVAFSTSYLKVI